MTLLKMLRGPYKGTDRDLATRQAAAAVAAGDAEYVNPPAPKPAAPPAPSPAGGSWLGPPGEVAPAAPAPSPTTGSWLGPPGELPPTAPPAAAAAPEVHTSAQPPGPPPAAPGKKRGPGK